MISNCFITDNYAYRDGDGIIIRSDTPEQANSRIVNCTIANNYGYGRYEVDCGNTKPVIKNTIIYGSNWRNLLISDPNLISYSCVGATYVFVNGSDEDEPCDITTFGGNINSGAYFEHPFDPNVALLDYHLNVNSASIDAGDPGFSGGGMDIDGDSSATLGSNGCSK